MLRTGVASRGGQSPQEAVDATADLADDCVDLAAEPPAACLGGNQRWRFHLAYDGTDFSGWQRQAGDGSGDGPTVQGVIEEALSRVFRAPVKTVGASRTDAGVHARGQVCHFDAPALWGPKGVPGLEPTVALQRVRRELPGAVLAVTLAHEAPRFHARLDAERKQYSYRLAQLDAVSPFTARTCWRCGALDVGAMKEAAASLDDKEVDFSAMSAGEPELSYHGGVRKRIRITVLSQVGDATSGCAAGEVLVLVSCERFLYRMVRRIVGGLVEVGKGRIQPLALAGASRAVIPTAPAGGLCLDEVTYGPDHPCPEADAAGRPPDLLPPPWP